MNISDEVKKIVSSFQQLPYLFIGTGISMRYASAHSWDILLYMLWESINGDDRQKYDKMIQRIEYELENELSEVSEKQRKYYVNPQIATELQKQFNTLFYKDESFESRMFTEIESKEIISNRYDPFKYYIAKIVEDTEIDETSSYFNEMQSLRKCNNKIAGIITTNYDVLMEKIFDDFSVLIGQDNMLLSNINSIFEIYKIHGSTSLPNSIILTQNDYKYFEDKLKCLSAKLLTIFVEHPIIFMGYGMGDLNIIKLFSEIAECLNPQQLDRTKSNFIFITPAFGCDEQIRVKELDFGNKRVLMTEIVLEDYSVFYKELMEIKSSLPVKLVRKVQDMVTNYIYSTEAKNNVVFGNINSPDIDDEKIAVYVGTKETVSQIGFDYFTIEDILEDVLFDNKPFLINTKLLTKTYKNIRSIAGNTYLPVYKYLKELNMDIKDLPSNYLIIKSETDIKPNRTEKSYVNESVTYSCLNDIILENPDHLPKQFANIKYHNRKIDADELGDYLRNHFNKGTYFEKGKLSTFKKLTALYDFKKYK